MSTLTMPCSSHRACEVFWSFNRCQSGFRSHGQSPGAPTFDLLLLSDTSVTFASSVIDSLSISILPISNLFCFGLSQLVDILLLKRVYSNSKRSTSKTLNEQKRSHLQSPINPEDSDRIDTSDTQDAHDASLSLSLSLSSSSCRCSINVTNRNK